jgi:FMN phosphatase YigB (HAD superfamily)
MGSLISAIYDDYDDYEYFCKLLKVKSVNIHNGFYEHQAELLKDLGFKHLSDYYAALRKAEDRDKKINSILGDD